MILFYNNYMLSIQHFIVNYKSHRLIYLGKLTNNSFLLKYPKNYSSLNQTKNEIGALYEKRRFYCPKNYCHFSLSLLPCGRVYLDELQLQPNSKKPFIEIFFSLHVLSWTCAHNQTLLANH